MFMVGLYVMFLLLEDVIVSNYSTDADSQDQEKNIEAAYDILKKGLALDKENKLVLNNPEQYYRKNLNISEQPKKWKLERVTQKQYEIINMLWRKTKIVVNEDYDAYTTIPTISKQKNTTKIVEMLSKNTHSRNQIKFSPISSVSYTTTPSKIEFYYNVYDTSAQDDKDECGRCKVPIKITKPGTSSLLPFLVFRIKSPDLKSQSSKLNASSLNNIQLHYAPIKISKDQVTRPQKNTHIKVFQSILKKEELNKMSGKVIRKIPPVEYLFESGTSKQTFSAATVNNIITPKTDSDVNEFDSESTTAYDKIRFFEMYDKNTRSLRSTKSTVYGSDVERKITKENNVKILLEQVDQGSVSDHKQAKHAKKHAVGSPRHNQGTCCEKDMEIRKKSNNKTNVIFKSYFNETANGFSASLLKPIFPYENKNVSWSEYPFAAVYIYEPLQVHCDAAAISTYWLVASGACLSRVSNNKPYGGIRSAFVTYCGDQWWQPEIVAYVKYSIVHPWFNIQDKTKKHLYNIGLIQVVNSMMSACSNWAPVSIMSHQFAADSEGTWASAIGWGLDRFDTKYGITDLPTTPLMVYNNILYFDSCPGNIGYSKAKRLDEGGGVSNVYCLSLPPYTGEEYDPVHGGLLLVGGKLIALYLQEERRPWGEQSALYTGVWRLIPWVMEMAKEPEEIDTLMFEL